MILNIDFNPKIREVYKTGPVDISKDNKIIDHNIYPRGNGYEINRLLNLFNLESILTGFLSEKDSSAYNYLSKSSIKSSFILINDEIYRELIIDDSKEKLFLSTSETRISEEEIVLFYNNYHSLLEDSELVLCIEDEETNLPKSIYKNIVHIANMANKKCFVEIRNYRTLDFLLGESFSCLINRDVLEDITKLYLNDISSITKASNYLIREGIEEVFVNLDGRGIVYTNRNDNYSYGVYKESSGEFSRKSIGVLAGVLIARLKNYDLESMLKLAHAINLIYSELDVLEEIELTHIKKSMVDMEIVKLDREEDR